MGNALLLESFGGVEERRSVIGLDKFASLFPFLLFFSSHNNLHIFCSSYLFGFSTLLVLPSIILSFDLELNHVPPKKTVKSRETSDSNTMEHILIQVLVTVFDSKKTPHAPL